jgi:dihydroorotase
MKTLIKNADVVLRDQIVRVDVLMDGQKIAAIEERLSPGKVDESIDATGLVLMPGVIDDQVHFREPGLTDKEDIAHASRACAKGGVTTFLEMPNTIPNVTNQALLDQKLAIAEQQSLVNYGFYIGATPDNIQDLKTAQRTPGIKIFIGSSTGDLLVDSQEALERIFAETTLPLTAHCEDEATVKANALRYAASKNIADHSRIRDHAAARIATARAIDLAERHAHRFHVLHVSTADEILLIAQHLAQHSQKLITGEACPHHLFFNIDDYARLGSLVKMNPSIKTAKDNAVLWQALHDQTLQVIATDHAPHTLAEKQLDFPACPSGLPAVENSLALLLDQVNRERCTLLQVAHWMSYAPAKVWDIVDKGEIRVGYDADLVLVDMRRKIKVQNEDQQTKCGWSPWHGQTLTGWPVKTWVRGQQVFELDVENRARFADKPLGHAATFDHQRGGYWVDA